MILEWQRSIRFDLLCEKKWICLLTVWENLILHFNSADGAINLTMYQELFETNRHFDMSRIMMHIKWRLFLWDNVSNVIWMCFYAKCWSTGKRHTQTNSLHRYCNMFALASLMHVFIILFMDEFMISGNGDRLFGNDRVNCERGIQFEKQSFCAIIFLSLLFLPLECYHHHHVAVYQPQKRHPLSFGFLSSF